MNTTAPLPKGEKRAREGAGREQEERTGVWRAGAHAGMQGARSSYRKVQLRVLEVRRGAETVGWRPITGLSSGR